MLAGVSPVGVAAGALGLSTEYGQINLEYCRLNYQFLGAVYSLCLNTETAVGGRGILVCTMPTTAFDANCDETKKCARTPAPPVSSAWRY
jgi:hypothetical protein